LPRQHPAHRPPLQVAQRFEQARQPHDLHQADDPARPVGSRAADGRNLQLHDGPGGLDPARAIPAAAAGRARAAADAAAAAPSARHSRGAEPARPEAAAQEAASPDDATCGRTSSACSDDACSDGARAGATSHAEPPTESHGQRRTAEWRQPLNAAEVMDEPQHLHPAAAPQRKLAFAFAKRHGILIKQLTDGEAECVAREHVSPLALAEVRRFVGRPLRLERVPETEFDLLLRAVYEAGSDTMQAVEGLDDTTDLAHLAQELPEQADLLDSNDDAPIIRLINAVLTQAVKENASDIHVEPFENRL